MPAVSKAQQRFMGMVHAADKGETPASPEVAKVSADMKDTDAKDFASTKHDGLPDHVKEQLKSVVREVIREKNGMNEMSSNDIHFKHIMKMYDRGGSFTKKKIGAVVCKDPKASRKDVEEALFDADYRDIVEFEDELGLKEIREKYNSVNEEFKHVIHVDTPTQVVSKPVAAQIMALAKKGVRSNEIGLEMGFVGNAKLAADTFQKVKNKIYFELDKRNESYPGFTDKKIDAKIVADRMRNHKDTKGFADKIAKMGKVSQQDLDKILPDYVTGGTIEKLFNESINEDIKSDVNKFLDKLNKEFPDQEYTTDFKGGKYARITHQSRKFGQPSAWGFIAMDDNPSKGFKKGDLLKAAGFNTPAKHARGNILNGDAKYDKYSPTYLKEELNEAKPAVVGNVNAFGPSKVLGKGGKVLGFVPDTPNAIATLIQDYPNVQAIEFKSPFFFDFNSYKSIKKGDKAWKELMSRGVDKATKAALKKDFQLKESVNEEHDCGCNENHDCGCGGVHEHIHEDLSADANGIAGLTASRASAVEDFLEKNNINSNKLYLFLKKGNLKDRMDFVTALVGKPGNPIQKKVIAQFSK